jgi:hypothetical protein
VGSTISQVDDAIKIAKFAIVPIRLLAAGSNGAGTGLVEKLLRMQTTVFAVLRGRRGACDRATVVEPRHAGEPRKEMSHL